MTLEEAKYVLDQFDAQAEALMRWSSNSLIPQCVKRLRSSISDALECKVLEDEIASSFAEVSSPRQGLRISQTP